MMHKRMEWICLEDAKDEFYISMRELKKLTQKHRISLFWRVPDKHEIWLTSWAQILRFLSEGRNSFLPRSDFSQYFVNESLLSAWMRKIQSTNIFVELTALQNISNFDLFPQINLFSRATWETALNQSTLPPTKPLHFQFNHHDDFYSNKPIGVPIFQTAFPSNGEASVSVGYTPSLYEGNDDSSNISALYHQNLLLVRKPDSDVQYMNSDSAHFSALEVDVKDIFIDAESYKLLKQHSVSLHSKNVQTEMEYKRLTIKDDCFTEPFRTLWNFAVDGISQFQEKLGDTNKLITTSVIREYLENEIQVASKVNFQDLVELVVLDEHKSNRGVKIAEIGVTPKLKKIYSILQLVWKPIVEKTKSAIENESDSHTKEKYSKSYELPNAYWYYKKKFKWNDEFTQPHIVGIIRKAMDNVTDDTAKAVVKISLIVPYYTQMNRVNKK